VCEYEWSFETIKARIWSGRAKFEERLETRIPGPESNGPMTVPTDLSVDSNKGLVPGANILFSNLLRHCSN
jgi:hypothetical protein